MKVRLFFLFAVAVMVMACGRRSYDVEIIPIQDNAKPRMMARALFSEAPDSLFESLGLQDGIPSSIYSLMPLTEHRTLADKSGSG